MSSIPETGRRGRWRRSLIEAILKNRLIPGIKVFPKGIPWPEIFEVSFEVGSGRTQGH